MFSLNRSACDATIAPVEHQNRNAPRFAFHACPVWLILVLVGAILAGGLPIITGVVVMPDSKPSFTLDVCHPLAAVACGLTQGEAPLIPKHAATPSLCPLGIAREFVARVPSGAIRPPDPPPPKIA